MVVSNELVTERIKLGVGYINLQGLLVVAVQKNREDAWPE